eukprot:1356981-Amorphochlora_amoeboformis.AAC.2
MEWRLPYFKKSPTGHVLPNWTRAPQPDTCSPTGHVYPNRTRAPPSPLFTADPPQTLLLS